MPAGNYTLRVDGSVVTDMAGNLLLGGEQLLQMNSLRFQDPVIVAPSIPGEAFTVPMRADMNGDQLADLVVGVKTSAGTGKIRIYYNTGSQESPRFEASQFLQADGSDLEVPASGCLGVYPRVFDWNRDGLSDLVLGHADGTISWAANIGSAETPVFGSFFAVQVIGTDLDVGDRATFDIVDWSNDGRYDLIVGNLAGDIQVLLNQADTGPALFASLDSVRDADGMAINVAGGRASISVVDLDADGKNDIVAGNTDGQLVYYRNIGTDASPRLVAGEMLVADSGVIDLDGTPRSRPFATDYNGDGLTDLLVGSQDGMVRLYLGSPWVTKSTIDYAGSPGTPFTYEFSMPDVVTYDLIAPSSHVNALAPSYSTLGFAVTWSGQDNSGGSGIASYDIWASDNGGEFRTMA